MLVQLNDVSKSFGSQTVLRDVSFQINPAEKIGLIGANGAGKTTLLKVIGRNADVDTGAVSRRSNLEIGNLEQIPEIVAFFTRNSDAVRLASFQLHADTGRGVLGRRDARITIASVRRQIELGAGTSLSFDTAQIGHARCNRYAMALVINGKVYDVLDDSELFNEVLAHTADIKEYLEYFKMSEYSSFKGN